MTGVTFSVHETFSVRLSQVILSEEIVMWYGYDDPGEWTVSIYVVVN